MAIQGIVGIFVLIAGSSVISANTNTTVPVSTLDDSTNSPNVSNTTVNPSTILSTSTEMDAPNSTTSQPITQVTSTSQPTTEGTSIIPESTTTTEGTSIIPESTTTTAPPHTRHFDGLSFLGGILLTVGAAGLLMGGYKYFGPGRGDKGAYNRIGMKDLYGESDHLQV